MGMCACTVSEDAQYVSDLNGLRLSAWLPLDISSELIIVTVRWQNSGTEILQGRNKLLWMISIDSQQLQGFFPF